MADSKDDNETSAPQDAAARRKARHAARARARDEDTQESDAQEQDGDESDNEADARGEREGEGEGDEEAQEAKEARPNRRERRRREKLGEEADAPSRDRNARIRAKHRPRKAAAEADENLTPLSTSEMLDDAVARGTARLGKWAVANATTLQFVFLALVVGGAGYGGYSWYTSSKIDAASADLGAALFSDRGRVDPSGAKPGSDEEEFFPIYKTSSERSTTALAAYRKAREAYPGSGTALLARLGEAGVLLDQRSYDEALAAYREVKASPLAAADPDVRGRCIEGIGFALEAKGDLDGALKVFKELDTITGIKTYKELGFYHQARLLAAKGEKDQALKLIKDARDRLQTTGEARNASYLMGVLEELQRKVDPTSLPRRGVGGPGRQLSLDELQKLQQQVLKEIQNAPGKGDGHQDEH